MEKLSNLLPKLQTSEQSLTQHSQGCEISLYKGDTASGEEIKIGLTKLSVTFPDIDNNYIIVLADRLKAQETAQDEINMKKYFAEKFFLRVNGVVKPMTFLSKEVEANVLICYFRIPDVSKISNLEIENSALTEWNSEQQNIIQANITGEKQSVMLTSENFKRVLK